MANPRAVPITLTPGERAMLHSWIRRRSTAQGLALRENIILAAHSPI